MKNINIGFSDNNCRVLILDESKKIYFQDEFDLGFKITDEVNFKKNKEDTLRIFTEKLNSLQLPESDKNVNVLLDTSLTFLNLFPFDFNEDKGNINSHILWELSNYYPLTYKDFLINYYRLHNNFFSESIDEVLLIAVDRNIIEVIKNLCNGNGFRISNIDIDQIAVEKYLKEKYGTEFELQNVVLIGCKNNRLDYSLYINGKLAYYDFQITGMNNPGSFLIKQIEVLNSVTGYEGIAEIFLYGDEKLFQIRDILSEFYKELPVKLVSTDSEDAEFTSRSIFAPLCGLGLKNYS